MSTCSGGAFTLFVDSHGDVVFCGRLDTEFGNLFEEPFPKVIWGTPEKMQQVSAGISHMALVSDQGNLFTCGHGNHGQLGLGTLVQVSSPQRIERKYFNDSNVIMAACGRNHTVALMGEGQVFAFGSNEWGQLGRGDFVFKNRPRQVRGGLINEDVIMIAAGDDHTVALTAHGSVWVWGCNVDGQLGIDYANTRVEYQVNPYQLDRRYFHSAHVFSIAAGRDCTTAVTVAGNLYTWGSGDNGVLGHGTLTNVYEPRIVESLERARVKVAMAACGGGRITIVSDDGLIWLTGSADTPQYTQPPASFVPLIFPFHDMSIVTVSAGDHFFTAVTENGHVYVSRWNDAEQIGQYNFCDFERETSSQEEKCFFTLNHPSVKTLQYVPHCIKNGKLKELLVGRFNMLDSKRAGAVASTFSTKASRMNRSSSQQYSLADLPIDLLSEILSLAGDGPSNLDEERHEGLRRLMGATEKNSMNYNANYKRWMFQKGQNNRAMWSQKT